MSVARAYARALYETACDKKASPDQLEDQLDSMGKVLNSSSEIHATLVGPIATTKEKTAIIAAIAKREEYSELLVQFLSLLVRKGRLGLLCQIRDSFVEVRLQAEGGVVGKLVAADAVNEKDVESLTEAFSKKLGKKVAFQVSTDEALLAGVKVTVNGVTYDGTLRSQLERLRDRLMVGLT